MDLCYKDKDYYDIVQDIINDNEFKKIVECVHHGLTRYEHSCRVSYYSYKLAKFLKLDYVSIARAGLLHDFFFSKNITKKDKMKSMFTHSKKSLENSSKLFELNEKEKDIIYTHMFPLNINRIPKYMESWVVSIVDKIAASYEFSKSIHRNYVLNYRNAILVVIFLFGKSL